MTASDWIWYNRYDIVNQYNTGPNNRNVASKERKKFWFFFSSGWGQFVLTCRVCLAADSASRTLRTTHCVGRTAQSAEHAVTQACSVQRGSLSSHNRYPRMLFSSLAAVWTNILRKNHISTAINLSFIVFEIVKLSHPYSTRSSATAERQRVSYARHSRSLTDRALHWTQHLLYNYNRHSRINTII